MLTEASCHWSQPFDSQDRGQRYISDDRTALDTSSRNNILQKAVKIYMQEKCSLEIDDAEVYLIPQKEIKLEKDQYGDVCIFSGSACLAFGLIFDVSGLKFSCFLDIESVTPPPRLQAAAGLRRQQAAKEGSLGDGG